MLREELVFLDHGGYCDFAFIGAIFDSHHTSLALNANTFGEGNLGRKRESESDMRVLLDRGLQIKTDAPGADIPQFGGLASKVAICCAAIDADRDAQRETSCTPLFLLGLGHAASKER